MVRTHPDPPESRGISSAGRAPALQAGGRRFDPVILHQEQKPLFKLASMEAVSITVFTVSVVGSLKIRKK